MVEVVERAQAGDTDAYGEIYQEYRDTVYWFIRRRVNAPDVAEDLTQDTFVRALRNIGRWQWRGRDIAGWLVTIARNLVFDHTKSAHERHSTPVAEFHDIVDLSPEGDPEATALDTIRNAHLVAALKRLTDGERQVLTHRFLREMTVAETAAAMGRTEAAVKALTYRATHALTRGEPDGVPTPAQIRAWAADHGVACPPRGRVPHAVMAAYERRLQ